MTEDEYTLADVARAIEEREFGGTDGFKYLPALRAAHARLEALDREAAWKKQLTTVGPESGQAVLQVQDATHAGFGVSIYLCHAGYAIPLGSGPTEADAILDITPAVLVGQLRRRAKHLRERLTAIRTQVEELAKSAAEHKFRSEWQAGHAKAFRTVQELFQPGD